MDNWLGITTDFDPNRQCFTPLRSPDITYGGGAKIAINYHLSIATHKLCVKSSLMDINCVLAYGTFLVFRGLASL